MSNFDLKYLYFRSLVDMKLEIQNFEFKEFQMKNSSFLLVFLIIGCSNQAENKANFEACVQRAEAKFQVAHDAICIRQSYQKAGECMYNIESNNALVRSKDNEITACATMYAPK